MPQPHPDNPNSQEQWQPWLNRHRAALFLLARQYLRTPQEAEDAMQEGFIKFWKSRHAADDPAAYLFTCVRSTAIDLGRAISRRKKLECTAPSPEQPPLLLSPLEQDERRRHIEDALATLPVGQREVLILKIWATGEHGQGLTFAQIAAALHIPLNTAASRYRYALQHLEAILSREVTCD